MTLSPTAVLPSVVPRTPGEAVDLLAARRSTGALHGPLGSLYFIDGQVTNADSPRAPGLADLLTGCGRITSEDWAQLVEAHGPHAGVGEALVEYGRLTRGELELGHLGTLFDAAFFVLADLAGGVWRFEPDIRHWLGPVTAVDAGRVQREVERRQLLLDRIWPWPQLDTAPVRPAERPRQLTQPAQPARRVVGRRQRELLDHADGRRTPADLARLLGRSGFGVTADVRRLAAAGLLDAPRVEGPDHGLPGQETPHHETSHEAPHEPPRRTHPRHAGPPAAAPAGPPGAPAAPVPPVTPGAPAPPRAPTAQTAPTARATSATSAAAAPSPARGLHRRVPGATLTGAGAAGLTHSARPPTPAAAHPLTVPDPDIALLTRVRTLLEARL
ncbi:hypothetical protein [Kitasatospora sp. NPDC097643]|uniref:hypothetical protein n=1 Tax=Kitasatospora sp. NPDC097643 TaxID=3157230 RepID=UPI00332DC78F